MPPETPAETSATPAPESTKAVKLSDHYHARIGDPPYTTHATELPERGYKVFVSWVSKITGKSDKRLLRDAAGKPMYVRTFNARTGKPGRINTTMREAVAARALAYRKAWVEGWAIKPTAPEEVEAGRPSEITPGDIADRMVRGYTVRRLMQDAYGPRLPTEYAARRALVEKPLPKAAVPTAYRTYTQQARERRAIADTVIDICDALGIVQATQLTWAAVLLILANYRTRRAAGDKKGRRQAEKIVEVITQALKHADLHRPETHVEPIPLLKTWRRDIGHDWDAEVGKRTTPLANELRYTDSEVGQLMIASEQGYAPWRVSMLMQVGASGRLGQAVQLTRKQWEPDRPGFRHGLLGVPGEGDKGGILLALTEREDRAMRAMIAEHHAEAEAAYRAEGTDYVLFPGDRSRKPANEKQLNMEWRALEIAAGVKHAENRAWYGMRRAMADLHERMYRELKMTDVRILESLTGHQGATGDEDKRKSLRTTIYQDQVRREVLLPASEIRDAVWFRLTANPDIISKIPQNLSTISPQRGPQKPRPKRKRPSRKLSGAKRLSRDLAKK